MRHPREAAVPRGINRMDTRAYLALPTAVLRLRVAPPHAPGHSFRVAPFEEGP